LLVQGDEQHMGLLVVQHNVPHVPQALVECGAEKRCNVLAQKAWPMASSNGSNTSLSFAKVRMSAVASMSA
jgi:hypothetical protein